MLIAGQGVADQHGVAFGGVERAIGLIGDVERREHDPGVHRQPAVGGEVQDFAVRSVGLKRSSSRLVHGGSP